MPSFCSRLLILLLGIFLYAGNAQAADCQHVVTNNWGSGFQGRIDITNTGSAPITNWTVVWGYADSTSVINVWNANGSGSNPVTATPPGWFSGIAPGATWSIGFNANGSGNGVKITGDICGSTTAPTAKLQLAKTWINGNTGDQISITTSGLASNASITSTASGSHTDTGAAVVVTVGETANLPAETFISGTASDYTTSDWICDNAANSVISPGGYLSITAADAGNTIMCAVSNEYSATPPTDTDCKHVVTNKWGSGFQAEIQITNTGSTPINNWIAEWAYSDGTVITALWNAVGSGTNPVTATPPPWFKTLAPGATWSIGFTANGSGKLSSISCSTVAPSLVTLTLVKQLINDNGGTATVSDFTLQASLIGGTNVLSGTSGVSDASLPAGDYDLSETGPPGYTFANLSCDTGVLAGTTLTVGAGDDITCEFINDDQPVTLTLVKVVNNAAGTATANQWILDASVSGVSVLNGVSGSTSVTSASLSAGDYVLSETAGPSGYRMDSISCDAGVFDSTTDTVSLSNGEAATCTFTNHDIVTDLSIAKSVDNPSPNVGDVVTFSLQVTNAGPDPATDVVVDDVLPSGLSFVAGSMTGGDIQNQSAPNLQWTINSLGVGVANSAVLQFQATVN